MLTHPTIEKLHKGELKPVEAKHNNLLLQPLRSSCTRISQAGPVGRFSVGSAALYLFAGRAKNRPIRRNKFRNLFQKIRMKPAIVAKMETTGATWSGPT